MDYFQETDNLLGFDGELYRLKSFYPSAKATDFFEQFLQTLSWQSEHLHLFGRKLLSPRLCAWYGDSSANYRYSGIQHIPLPWTAELQVIRDDMQTLCGQPFNSVLANLYRDGKDSMGRHADNEKELGKNPLIASISFGATRMLRFKHKQSGEKCDIALANGDVLIMAGTLQQHWLHELPKTRRVTTARVNLTFRLIQS